MSERSARHVHAHAIAEGLRGIPIRVSRHLCQNCRERRARFRYRGAVKTDTDHTLCFECYRALHNSLREMVRSVSFWALRATTRGSQGTTSVVRIAKPLDGISPIESARR